MTKVLLVDDEAVLRWPLRCMLEVDGHVVLEGEDGEETVEKFRSEKPDLVYLDIKMPQMDGTEALKKIRETDGKAKVIMLTALEDILMEQGPGRRGPRFLAKGDLFRDAHGGCRGIRGQNGARKRRGGGDFAPPTAEALIKNVGPTFEGDALRRVPVCNLGRRKYPRLPARCDG